MGTKWRLLEPSFKYGSLLVVVVAERAASKVASRPPTIHFWLDPCQKNAKNSPPSPKRQKKKLGRAIVKVPDLEGGVLVFTKYSTQIQYFPR